MGAGGAGDDEAVEAVATGDSWHSWHVTLPPAGSAAVNHSPL